MDIKTLGKPLRKSDFHHHSKGTTKDDKRATENSRQEVRLSIIANKHIERLGQIELTKAAILREKEIDRLLESRGIFT